MITSTFNPELPLRYVRYGRMSDEEQNPRSPDQQFDEIDRTKKRNGRDNWVHLQDFRDDAISGRYKRKRPGFRALMDGIRTGLVKPDAIVVDTLERLGRVDEMQQIRDELRKKYGVLVLTADTGFTDPTTVVGRIYGVMEAVRASSAAAQKAHDVLRGKIDVVMMKRWPGGPPPCGYRLAVRTELVTRRNGKTIEKLYHILEPDPATVDIPRHIYQLAFEKGWGRTRIAKALNRDDGFVHQHGRVNESLVGSIMTNSVYKGLFRFNFLATDIEDDCRIIRKKNPDEVIYIEDFCEPIIDSSVIDKVSADVRRRSQSIMKLRESKKSTDGKQVQPLNQGLTLVYPLTGLVRCAECGAAMRPSKSGAKSKTAASYYYYRCPCANDGRCTNRLYLRGPWLWQVVVARLRETLFPLDENNKQKHPAWLCELIAEVRSDLVQRLENNQDRKPLLERELKDIDAKVAGWTNSLSKPDLSTLVRVQIEQQLGEALERKQIIEVELETLSAGDEQIDESLDPQAAVDRLLRLDEVFVKGNPSDINVELSLHIESIQVSSEGIVAMRTNRLGIFEGVPQILAADQDYPALQEAVECNQNGFQIRPRVLSRRHITAVIETSHLTKSDGLIEGHVNLPDKWVDESIFQMPRLISWAEQHAEKVFRRRQAAKLSYAKLGAEFGVTPPTARAAVQHYLASHPDTKDEINLPRGGKRPPKFDLSKFGYEARNLWEAGSMTFGTRFASHFYGMIGLARSA